MAKLKTEQNTARVEKLVRSAARQKFGVRRGYGRVQTVYEHGQWWAIVPDYHGHDEDATFSVVDAEPGIGTTGLDFEEV